MSLLNDGVLRILTQIFRRIGFTSLYALTSSNEGPTYAGLNTLLSLPVAALSLIGGLKKLHNLYSSYSFLEQSALLWVGTGVIPDPC